MSLASLWRCEDAAAADDYTINTLGVPSVVLMERVALAVAREVMRCRGNEAIPVCVLVGPGNNGGDGLAMARILAGWGVPVEALLVSDRRNDANEAQLKLARAIGVPIGDHLPERAVVVDALLGTGATGALRGAIAAAVADQARTRGPKIAIDVPTGVDASTGEVAGDAFAADLTLTVQHSKPGLHVTPGRAYAGQVRIVDVGIMLRPAYVVPDYELILSSQVATWLQGFGPVEHKGQRGHVAVIGGSAGTPGAAILAGTAAMRSGAGLCTLVGGDPTLHEALIAHRPELMAMSWSADRPCPGAHALVVGPGLTHPPSGISELFERDPRPAIWDASGLDAIAGRGSSLQPAGPRVLTPHPGEAARLLARFDDQDWQPADVQRQRWRAAQTLAVRSGAVVVLKGAGSIVATPTGAMAVATVGSDALATAGSGDVLAGMVGALLARGLPAEVAASVAVHVHGLAGQWCGSKRPFPVAEEIALAVPEVWRRLVAGEGQEIDEPTLERG